MKYLLALALLALLAWLLYRRLRPYIQVVRQFLNLFRGTLSPGAASPAAELRDDVQSARSRLVRCAACDTWVPMNRTLQSNGVYFCSTACVKKAPAIKRRKTAS